MSIVNPPQENLAAAIRRHGIELPAGQVALLEEYCRLLWDWNTKLNLTRHTDYERFTTRDLVDSLAFAEFLRPGEKVLDVGTGGGVPGVVLAIVRSDLKVALCESVGKKARAVAEIVERLGLTAPVYHARAEDLLGDHRFDTLVIRAVARLRKLLECFKPRWRAFDRMLVLTGPSWVEQRGEARHFGLLKDMALRKLKTYPMPGSEAQSVLLQICPEERPGKIGGESGKGARAKAPRREEGERTRHGDTKDTKKEH
jgi:16S rRNA (guanine527-N7)-methyltransferase